MTRYDLVPFTTPTHITHPRAAKANSPDNPAGIPHGRFYIASNMTTLELMMDTLSVHGFLDDPPKARHLQDAVEWNQKLEESMNKVIGPKPLLPEGYGSDWIHPRIRKQSLVVEPVRAMVKRVKAKKKVITTT
jgi:hypothetical protein